MPFITIVNVNEKRINSKEALMKELMDAYDKLENSEGEEIYSLTLRLNVWIGDAPSTTDRRVDG